MSTRVYFSGGELMQFWDDATRTYTQYDPEGATVIQRAYTPEENAVADANVLLEGEQLNEQTVRTATEARLAQLDSEIIGKTNAELFTQSGTGAALKLLARTLRLVIRLLIRRFDGTD